MTFHVDTGVWSWHVVAGQRYGKDPWKQTEGLIRLGAVFHIDSPASLRKQYAPWYKSHRSKFSDEMKARREAAHQWVFQLKERYPEHCNEIAGLEADDLIAIKARPGDRVLSLDKDLLQIDNGITLIDANLAKWTIAREQKKTKLPLAVGERWLVYQLLYGDTTDDIPRLLLSKDRETAKWVFAQKNPMGAALQVLPLDWARVNLNLLIVPTPLYYRVDPLALWG